MALRLHRPACELVAGQASMNLTIIPGLQAGAVQGAASGEAAPAAAPSQAASPFAMLLAILSETPAEAPAQAQPVQPQQPAEKPQPAQKAQPAFLSPSQIETNDGQPDEPAQSVEPHAAGSAVPPAQEPLLILAAPELPLASPPAAVGEVPAKIEAKQALEQIEAKQAVDPTEPEAIAAPLPHQPLPHQPLHDQVSADAAIGADALSELALPQISPRSDAADPAPQQKQLPSDGQSADDPALADNSARADAAKANISASAGGAAVDPMLAGAPAKSAKGPAAAPDPVEGIAPQERKRGAAADARNAPAPDAPPKPNAPLDADVGAERPPALAPFEALKPAESRVAADVAIRVPESVAATPPQQAEPGPPRPASAQPPSPQIQVAVPVEGLAIQIARTAKSGERKFEIRLDPPELGKVSVRMEVSREGVVTTHLTVERAETMDLLQRDARALERALGQAGLDQKGGGISFSLSDQNAHPQHDGRDTPQHSYAMASDEMLPADSPAQPARFRSANALLDIRI